MTTGPTHSYEDLGRFKDDPEPDLEGHLNSVHRHRLVSLMGMSPAEKEAMHASDHLLGDLDLSKTAGGVFMALMVSMSPVLEMVTGYKKTCMEAGFSEEIAEMMAAHLHGALCKHIGGSDGSH